ncbi:hypothetical protein CKO22_18540 [Thiococcus pfennigii]|nr:hypothetical protein [Thiococcus pfennigii]
MLQMKLASWAWLSAVKGIPIPLCLGALRDQPRSISDEAIGGHPLGGRGRTVGALACLAIRTILIHGAGP